MRPRSAVLLLVLAAAASAQHVHTDRSAARRLPLPKEDGVWHFVVFGDRTGGPAEGIRVLEQAVRDTNLLDPDLVMTVGDLVQGYNETPQWMEQMREFHGVMNGLRMPWYPVAGNHDTFWRRQSGREERPRDEHDASYETHFGPLWYWFAHKGAAFIVLYTDETDPATGKKNYHVAGGQRMSPEQRAWLTKTLAKTRDYEHCFVFVHHPRWIQETYPHSDWKDIEKMLLDAGNVSGVFAGHVHKMHFAETPGRPGGRPLPYYTLATTGGNVAAGELEKGTYDHGDSKAGYLHHVNVVTVRKGRISVSAIPVGAVIDPRSITDELRAAAKALRGRGSSYPGPPLMLRADGTARGVVRLKLENPTRRPVEYTLVPDGKNSQFAFWPDHLHRKIPPGAKREVVFHYARGRRGLGPFRAPVIIENVDWIGEGIRLSAPEREVPLDIATDGIATDDGDSANGVLHLDGRSEVRVRSSAATPPDGPITLEAWVWAESLKGRRPLVNKTENSGYGIFMNDGRAEFMVHLDGKYVSAKMPGKTRLRTKQWHHVAGVYDEASVRLFIDGKPVASTAGSGRRTTNALPLYIGADPNERGRPVNHLRGFIDEVRVSTVARYRGAFSPSRRHRPDAATLLLLHLDRDLGPLTIDSSPHGNHPMRGGNAWCGEPLRPPQR